MKKSTKIIAGVAAMALIAFVLVLANSLVGNPVSKILANRTMPKYLEKTYPTIDFEIDEVIYNFKFGNYTAYVRSKTSMDTHFFVYLSPFGTVVRDGYEGNVLGKFNTYSRIDRQYADLVKPIFEDAGFPKSDIHYATLAIGDTEASQSPYGDQPNMTRDDLELDRVYDMRTMGEMAGSVVVYIQDEQVNADQVGQQLLKIKALFDRENVAFRTIDLTLEQPKVQGEAATDGQSLAVKFQYRDIYPQGLTQRVEENIQATKSYYEEQDKIKDQGK